MKSNVNTPKQAQVIVLEDDPIMQTIIKSCLSDSGLAVHCASTISQFNEISQLINPDMIISDIHLPDGNGLSHCLSAHKHTAYRCPIIAITASEKRDAIGEVFNSGADDYIQKPFISEELIARVSLHLKISEHQKAMLAILEDQPTGIFMLDEKGIVLYSNSLARKWLKTKAVVGVHWLNWLTFHAEEMEVLEDIFNTKITKTKLTKHKHHGNDLYLEWNLHQSPINTDQLLVYINNLTELTQLRNQLNVSHNIIGNSTSALSLANSIKQLAQVNWNILILGETGTGKELVAHSLHDQSNRKDAPFIAINCAGLSGSLLNDQLFGHEKGAFTDATNMQKGVFEQANGGTLFLDEIGDMPLSMQGTLLRVLQERCITRLGSNKSIPIDVRLIFATHQNLLQMISDGKFRGDLYYRINSAHINVPPLRERQQDIPLILQYWLEKDCQENQLPPPNVNEEALLWLSNQAWAGNVRQVQQVVKHFILIAQSEIDIQAAKAAYVQSSSPEIQHTEESLKPLVQATLSHEALQIINAMQQMQGNKEAAAKLLGISRATLYRKLNKHKLLNNETPSQ